MAKMGRPRKEKLLKTIAVRVPGELVADINQEASFRNVRPATVTRERLLKGSAVSSGEGFLILRNGNAIPISDIVGGKIVDVK